jgi:hypothetical protein
MRLKEFYYEGPFEKMKWSSNDWLVKRLRCVGHLAVDRGRHDVMREWYATWQLGYLAHIFLE